MYMEKMAKEVRVQEDTLNKGNIHGKNKYKSSENIKYRQKIRQNPRKIKKNISKLLTKSYSGIRK